MGSTVFRQKTKQTKNYFCTDCKIEFPIRSSNFSQMDNGGGGRGQIQPPQPPIVNPFLPKVEQHVPSFKCMWKFFPTQ